MAWGSGTHGKLGFGDAKVRITPTWHENFTKQSLVFTKVVLGVNHTVGLTDKGQLWAWGAGLHGELGNGGYNRKFLPTLIPFSEKVAFKDVSVGYEYTIATTESGDAYGWGSNEMGRLANGLSEGIQLSPIKLKYDIKFKAVYCGRDFVIALGDGTGAPKEEEAEEATEVSAEPQAPESTSNDEKVVEESTANEPEQVATEENKDDGRESRQEVAESSEEPEKTSEEPEKTSEEPEKITSEEPEKITSEEDVTIPQEQADE